jgi:uncharacterized protein
MDRFFEWDARKAESNFQKHGITFEDATRAFDDPFAVSERDRIENGEERWRTVGMVDGCMLVLVAHTVRNENESAEIVRLISARQVDRKERRRYENG